MTAWPARAPRAPVAAPTIRLGGRLLDGANQPVPDAMIETWQADADGRFPGPGDVGFPGFGRTATAEDGSWHILTVRPGAILTTNGVQAPHIAICVFGRGLLRRLVTRAYFANAVENEDDAVLALVPAARRHTLLARAVGTDWLFDIRLQGGHLQGETETVFFDV